MTSPTTAETSRTVWAAIIMIVAVLIGATAGLLSAAAGMRVPLAVVAGGGAFGGTIGLLLSLATFLGQGKG